MEQSNDLEKAKDYYLKGAELCSVEGNSFRSELIHTAGNATFLMGDIDESFKFFNESLEIEFDLYPRMKGFTSLQPPISMIKIMKKPLRL